MLQKYELLQGNLVRFSPDASTKDVPTAVLVHGILGSKRNLNGFARMIAEVGACGCCPVSQCWAGFAAGVRCNLMLCTVEYG